MRPDEKERYKKYLKNKRKEVNKSGVLKKKYRTRNLENEALKNQIAAHHLAEDQKRQKNIYELMFKKMLDEFGVKYIWQQPFSNSYRYCVADFYIPSHNVVVEIDGKPHTTKHGRVKDQSRTDYLRSIHKVSSVLRINNSQLLKNGYEVKELVISRLI